VLRSGIQVDVRAVPEQSYGAALLYFTGSKAHNIALRAIAVRRCWKLNEYGLFSGRRRIAGETEDGTSMKSSVLPSYLPNCARIAVKLPLRRRISFPRW
jgi:DNA polymerase/3'-5' exonuclease PolX